MSCLWEKMWGFFLFFFNELQLRLCPEETSIMGGQQRRVENSTAQLAIGRTGAKVFLVVLDHIILSVIILSTVLFYSINKFTDLNTGIDQ